MIGPLIVVLVVVAVIVLMLVYDRVKYGAWLWSPLGTRRGERRGQ